MKKKILLLVMSMMVCFSAVALASNASYVPKEENVAQAMLKAFEKGKYQPNLFIKDYKKDTFYRSTAELKKLGKLKSFELLAWNKQAKNVDLIVGAATYEKAGVLQVIALLETTGKEPKIINYNIRSFPQPKAAPKGAKGPGNAKGAK